MKRVGGRYDAGKQQRIIRPYIIYQYIKILIDKMDCFYSGSEYLDSILP
jgi:hypothetical protein